MLNSNNSLITLYKIIQTYIAFMMSVYFISNNDTYEEIYNGNNPSIEQTESGYTSPCDGDI